MDEAYLRAATVSGAGQIAKARNAPYQNSLQLTGAVGHPGQGRTTVEWDLYGNDGAHWA